jgi:hypothetical protein
MWWRYNNITCVHAKNNKSLSKLKQEMNVGLNRSSTGCDENLHEIVYMLVFDSICLYACIWQYLSICLYLTVFECSMSLFEADTCIMEVRTKITNMLVVNRSWIVH